ncbi:hypothetical protein ACIG8K_05325 [Streptomyces halstedii]
MSAPLERTARCAQNRARPGALASGPVAWLAAELPEAIEMATASLDHAIV